MNWLKKLFGGTTQSHESSPVYDNQQYCCPKCGCNEWQENRPMRSGEALIECECTACGHKWTYRTYLTGSGL